MLVLTTFVCVGLFCESLRYTCRRVTPASPAAPAPFSLVAILLLLLPAGSGATLDSVVVDVEVVVVLVDVCFSLNNVGDKLVELTGAVFCIQFSNLKGHKKER